MIRGPNPTSASRLTLSRLGQPGSIPTLVQPSDGMAVRHQKGAIAERFLPYGIVAVDTTITYMQLNFENVISADLMGNVPNLRIQCT
ncbi:hypothetical protein T265_07153 [Opisthorchis viverrini]|uniref:Uncharacterized protein n=1 Tax=Opisthorchis viverrini TaxID=6198 RepID=A0A075ACA4_OPIVI|nr:hypothetical protein T265_07153 [Opisthorchis viverrini]KER25349.1 hypothetical protein T265_07153 [Opisthorchis viverrini]